MEIEKQVSDIRGKIIFVSFNKKQVNIVETKKGFSRGGHYHKFKSDHILLQGKIEFRELISIHMWSKFIFYLPIYYICRA